MKKFKLAFSACFLGIFFLEPAWAANAGGGMPWEGPMDQVFQSIQGPVARILGALAIVFTGIGVAFSEGGGLMKKALWVLFGLSIAFSAVSWGLPLLGFSGGVLI